MMRALPIPRILPLVAALVALAVFVIHDAPPAVAQLTPQMIVSPTSLTVPVGGRGCYVVRAITRPTGSMHLTRTAPGANNNKLVWDPKPTFELDNAQQYAANSALDWKIGWTICVKGAATTGNTPVRIDHTLTATGNYSGVSVPSVNVIVVAANSKPTVRFLYSEKMGVIEGDTVEDEDFENFDDHDLTKVTVKLDIAPAPTSSGQITWLAPHPDCNGTVTCKYNPSGDARYSIDFLPTWLMARQVSYTSGSNDMEFDFHVVADNVQESDETTKIYLIAQYFGESIGFRKNNDVCIGACSSPTDAQQSLIIEIMDDDSPRGCNGCSTEGDIGRIRIPQPEEQAPPDEEQTQNQERRPNQQPENEEPANQPPANQQPENQPPANQQPQTQVEVEEEQQAPEYQPASQEPAGPPEQEQQTQRQPASSGGGGPTNRAAPVVVARYVAPLGALAFSRSTVAPGQTVTVTGTGFVGYVPVQSVTVGGLEAFAGGWVLTDPEGKFTVDVTVPGLNPGRQPVVATVGGWTASSYLFIDPNAVVDTATPAAQAWAGVTVPGLVVWHFDNESQKWRFYDPTLPEFSDLEFMETGKVYLVQVGATTTATLNGQPRSLTCVNGNCWNVILW